MPTRDPSDSSIYGPLTLLGAVIVAASCAVAFSGGVQLVFLGVLVGSAIFGVGMWGNLPIRRSNETLQASWLVASGAVLVAVSVLMVAGRKAILVGDWDLTVEAHTVLLLVALVLVVTGHGPLKRATG